jgi:hypothetical protein
MEQLGEYTKEHIKLVRRHGDIEMTIPSGRVLALAGTRPPDMDDDLQAGDLLVGKLEGKDVIYWCNGTEVYPIALGGLAKLLANGGLAFGGTDNDELYVNLGPGLYVDTTELSPTKGKILPNLAPGLAVGTDSADPATYNKILPKLAPGLTINANNAITPNLAPGLTIGTDSADPTTYNKILPKLGDGLEVNSAGSIVPLLGLGVKLDNSAPVKKIVPNIASGDGLMVDPDSGVIKINPDDIAITITTPTI